MEERSLNAQALQDQLFLKRKPHGEAALRALRRRMQVQLDDPRSDPISANLLEAVDAERPEGKILDAGCYTGALYHYLGKPHVGYLGIDVWKEVIQVAREFAPKAFFLHCDLMRLRGRYDVIWASGVNWKKDSGVEPAEALAHMKTLAPKLIVTWVDPDSDGLVTCEPRRIGEALHMAVYEQQADGTWKDR